MPFQEQIDPLIEKLQQAIDEFKADITNQEFEKVLGQIDAYFPFVDLSEFVEMYVDGEYPKTLIELFHLAGHLEYQKLLQILKLPQKRKSTQKTAKSREINLTNKKLAERYALLKKTLSKFRHQIKNKITYNVLRSVILFYLYAKTTDFTGRQEIIRDIPSAVADFEHLILAPHTPISQCSKEQIHTYANSILGELREDGFLETNSASKLRLKKYQLHMRDYVLNTIHNREGITHQKLLGVLKNKIPILAQMPPALFQVTLHELASDNQIVKKEGYWKFKPSYDEYFTSKYWRKTAKNSYISDKKGFFGRKISPDGFIKELKQLDRGDFEDHDDQVTRIAGMILANSPMMAHPPNELSEFDFVVDLSNYTFTKEQQNVIQDLNIEIRSNIICVKVMTDAAITIDQLSNLILKLRNRGRNEQGFVISFEIVDGLVEKMLNDDKTIQMVSEIELKEWCKITPVIPSRRGAVAIVRQGHNKGEIVRIKSVNYESGMADIVFLTDMKEDILYIGSLEEITLDVPMKQFTDYSGKYFEFLRKLYHISKTDVFRSVVTGGSSDPSSVQHAPYTRITTCEISGEFSGGSKPKIDLDNRLDKKTLFYSAGDLFSCTCFAWGHMSKTQGLCEHLIYLLNESIKKMLSKNTKLPSTYQKSVLSGIESRMDLFLRRLRYANSDGASAVCPNCGCTAQTLGTVDRLFGYRQMNKNNKFSLRRQSRCNKCRGQ